MKFSALASGLVAFFCATASAQQSRSMRFQANTPAEALAWQPAARAKLFSLMMGGWEPARVPLDPRVLHRFEEAGEGYSLAEASIQTLPDRRARVWIACPTQVKGKVGAVLALHGHGGSGEQVVRGRGLYWYGRQMAQAGYIVISPDIGQHELQHTNWCLMGERTWDALRCVDYLLTMPQVDPERIAVAGLSLGGETAMYVAALDTRVKAACSSGWLSTVANLKNGHCPCFDFPGLSDHFDFADIFACVAPRSLVCELGEQERAPGGFPVSVGRAAFDQIRCAYRVFNAESNLVLTVHPGPHVFDGRDFWTRLQRGLGRPARPLPDQASTAAWIRFADGSESLEGVPYRWLGREELQVTFDVPPERGDALELYWGSKADERAALLLVNGKQVPVQAGGHWGFRWVHVALPPGITGDRYVVQLRKAEPRPAFLSEIRLVRHGAASAPRKETSQPQPDLRQLAGRAKLELLASGAASRGEAFPEMRQIWERVPQPSDLGASEPRLASLLHQAEQNSRQANEAFFRCRRYIDGWLAHADPDTGLIPRNLRESQFWNGRDSAADNYAFMVLTAAMTDPPLLEGRLLQMLRTETRLTSRVGRLPDDYSFDKKGWRREKVDLDAIIFDGAEYVKDGLLYIDEWLGHSPWSERSLGIIDDIWEHAPVQTPYGKIPTLNFEVNGDLLQACSRLYWFTGDRKYFDWATRLGDYYLLGTNHPTRDLKQLRLLDHGCEVVNGLTELYVAASHASPEKARAYQKPLHELFDCILEKGRNADGLLYSWFEPQTGKYSKGLCDTWGYVYDGFYTLWLMDRTESYRAAVRLALGNLKGKYVGACWDDQSADGFADSIEGALNLFNREPVDSAADWIESQVRMMWAIQKPDGVIEGWHGDGNFARTSLMYALWKTQGATLRPWRADVRFGAARDGGVVALFLTADQPWEGKFLLDRPRHKLVMHLPLDYTRINQFPEWFTVFPEARYRVRVGSERAQELNGVQLAQGLTLKLTPGSALSIEVAPR